MTSYNLHRRQLFHWIGRHIETPDSKKSSKLTDQQRADYVACLKTALQKGLWAKTPTQPDQFGNGDLVKVTRPIVCFTEWALDQSIPHTTRYGRLGLGFPKNYVLKRGGQPVSYVRDKEKRNPYTASMLELAKHLKAAAESEPDNEATQLARDQYDYLSHFIKKIREETVPPRTTAKAIVRLAQKFMPAQEPASAGLAEEPQEEKPKPPRKVRSPFDRRYGVGLQFLEEREWRIVYHKKLSGLFTNGPGGGNPPEHYMPFQPGQELFTVVLPDNETLNMAVDDPEIREMFYLPLTPHVTLLSLNDVGTF